MKRDFVFLPVQRFDGLGLAELSNEKPNCRWSKWREPSPALCGHARSRAPASMVRRPACSLSRSRALSGPSKQQGFVLAFGLLLLLVMSLIGLTMMSSNRLETKLSGGERESAIAFQAAEAALRDGEADIEAIDPADGVAEAFPPASATGGHVGEDADEPDYFAAATWDDSLEMEQAIPEMPAGGQPRYITKHVGTIKSDSPEIGGVGDNPPVPTPDIFRVTARGTSRDGASVRLLQSYYARQFP